eukprot:TRINITY_DN4541_c0_g1_i3.p1 TRINITY_DN4541_c0_g1~~TRINITY_DN4541_c0_g1_i3.p1  ORF type:complete len:288 (+),score=19.39 TRINITY_DN4541_c0_g1_i3:39-902(+)
MPGCLRLVQLLFMASLLVAFISSAVIFGFDVDFLRNGPSHLHSIIVSAGVEYKDVDSAKLLQAIHEASSNVWIHMPLYVIGCICVVIMIMCFFGGFGSVLLCYTLLAGYVIIKFVALVGLAFAVLWIFGNNLKESKAEKFLMEKMSEYGDNAFSYIIDFVQSDLHCCGLRSASDWDEITSPLYPRSCCPVPPSEKDVNCSEEVCLPCFGDRTFEKPCLTAFRQEMFDSSSWIGFVGSGLLAIIIIVVFNFFLALYLCLVARKKREKEQRSHGEKSCPWATRNDLELL